MLSHFRLHVILLSTISLFLRLLTRIRRMDMNTTQKGILLSKDWKTLRRPHKYLLQESYQLACAPLIRFRQIEVFKIEYQSFTVLRSVHTASIGANDHTHLLEFL